MFGISGQFFLVHLSLLFFLFPSLPPNKKIFLDPICLDSAAASTTSKKKSGPSKKTMEGASLSFFLMFLLHLQWKTLGLKQQQVNGNTNKLIAAVAVVVVAVVAAVVVAVVVAVVAAPQVFEKCVRNLRTLTSSSSSSIPAPVWQESNLFFHIFLADRLKKRLMLD